MRLESLLAALQGLFGPRLDFREAGGEEAGVVILWDGQVDGVVTLPGGEPEIAVWHLLNTAQDVWLGRLGEEGTHPGEWANASPDVVREGEHLRLSLTTREGQRAEAAVPLSQL